ncbi:MAG: AtpZ/AtpI family protein [Patescibacteria group bacterium]
MSENSKPDISVIATGIELAVTVVVAVLFFVVVGRWLDISFSTGFIFSAVGAVLGVCTATALVVRRVSILMHQAEEEKKQPVDSE